jgi:hypothetical protein
MEDKFDICDGHIWFFPSFPMEIYYCFEVFRLYSLFIGWKFPTFQSLPIIFPLQRMEIPDVSKISDNISFSKDGNPQCFEVFRLYFHCKGWKSPTFRRFPIIFPFQTMEIPDISNSNILSVYPFQRKEIPEVTAKNIMSNKVLIQFYYTHTTDF